MELLLLLLLLLLLGLVVGERESQGPLGGWSPRGRARG
jgi:hypothetical protein